MGTTYEVVLALSTTGNLSTAVGAMNAGLGRAHDTTHALRHAVSWMGETAERMFHGIGDTLEGVADRITNVTEKAAALGIGAVFGAATYGVMHLNNELEQTTISLGAIFQAQGFTDNFTQAFGMATDQVAKMKQDVKTLPGTLGELGNMMKVIATPAAHGGLGADEIRKLSGRTMLVSQILGVNQDMAAREMANLLSGRAGSHNILGLRLGLSGDSAKHFNAESSGDRVKEIQKLFDGYQGAADKFSSSFKTQFTTLKDNISYGFLAEATAPLFDKIKGTLVHINTWFDEHKSTVSAWAHTFGMHLASAWDGAMAIARKFGPALENIGQRFFQLWDMAVNKAHTLEPLINKLAEVLKNVSVEDITRGAKEVLALKLAGMGVHATGTMLNTGLQAGMMVGNLSRAGLIGGGGGGISTALASIGGIETAIAAVGTAAALAIPLIIATGGAIDDLTDTTGRYHKEAVSLLAHISENMSTTLANLENAAHPTTNALRDFGDYLGVGLLHDLEAATNALSDFSVALRWLKDATKHPGESADDLDARARFNASIDVGGPLKDHVTETIASTLLGAPGLIVPKEKKPPGSPGTNIQKVEIVVKGSDDPSRVARLVHERLNSIARNPTRSPYVSNWSR